MSRQRARWIVFFAVVLAAAAAVPNFLFAAGPPGPTLENVAYGPHERNVLDLWKADSQRPTPLVVFIHGGGFQAGDKSQVRRRSEVRQCLDRGVSFAAINYRFREHAAIQDILRDAARAIQFIRGRAAEWNIDPQRIAAFGGSAGAGTSLWLAFHDDLADPKADDPVLRQSSRLSAAGSLDGQVSYDLRDWDAVVGSLFRRTDREWLDFYRFASEAEMKSAEADRVMKDCSMIGCISKDDPPVAVASSLEGGEAKTRGDYVHHPKHSIAIAERCKEQGVPCLLLLRDENQPARADQTRAVVAFLIEKLVAAGPAIQAD